MNYSTTHIIYFSPTHTSAKIARAVGHGIGMEQKIETNLTCDFETSPIVVKNELAVIAVPVYAGRVAPLALQRIKRLRGENTPAILIVVYGNRDYEDALVELRDAVIRQGFFVISAGAFIGEHSYSRIDMPIAEGRPNESDIARAETFGKKSANKLEKVLLSGSSDFYIKGNIPYKEVASPTPAAPVTLEEQCVVCGNCLDLCPTNAIFINSDGIVESDKMKCIKCCACVKDCPSDARVFDTPYTAMLHAKCSVPREPELFF